MHDIATAREAGAPAEIAGKHETPGPDRLRRVLFGHGDPSYRPEGDLGALAGHLHVIVSADRRHGGLSVTVNVSNHSNVTAYLTPMLVGRNTGPRLLDDDAEPVAISPRTSWAFTIEPADDDEEVGVLAATSPHHWDGHNFSSEHESVVVITRPIPERSLPGTTSSGATGSISIGGDSVPGPNQPRHHGFAPPTTGADVSGLAGEGEDFGPGWAAAGDAATGSPGATTTGQHPPAPSAAAGEARTAEAPPNREVFGDIQAPSRAVVGEEFEVKVGLAEALSAGVASTKLDIPTGPTTIELQVIAPGFRLREQESWRNVIATSEADPFPTVALHLTAESISAETEVRGIDVKYALDGEVIGLASRYVSVVSSRDTAVQPQIPSEPMPLPVTTSLEKPDLTITISKPRGSGIGQYQVTLDSPHPVELPDAPESIDIGAEALDFAEAQIEQVKMVENTEDVYRLLIGRGVDIARQLPDALWTVLHRLKQQVGDQPLSVLLLSAEPHIPWELAYMTEPIEPSRPPFLGAQVILGRWPFDKPPPPAQPPDQLSISRFAVISGVYDTPEFRRLQGAETEAQTLSQDFGAMSVQALKPEVYSALEADPPNDIIHFAIHGKFDHQGYQNGLIMIDKKVISPDLVKGTSINGTPFVFLNACQVGTGDEALGDYSGMAHAFLLKGATGVVAPLWSINDAVAADICVEFYRRVLNEGEAPAAVMWDVRGRFSETTTTSAFMAYQFFGHPALRLAKR